MDNLVLFLQTLFWGALVLSVLVYIHEAGHFLAARLSGVRVREFFLGLPCRYAWKYTSPKSGVTYGVTPILLGGYTKICGMEYRDDPYLARVLAYASSLGKVSVSDVAATFQIEADEAERLLEVLVDWGSLDRGTALAEQLGSDGQEHDSQQIYTTLARDEQGLVVYDRAFDHTKIVAEAGSPYTFEGTDAEFLAHEYSHTYQAAKLYQRIAMLLGGIVVNIAFAILLITILPCVFGIQSYSEEARIGSVVEQSYAAEVGIERDDRIVKFNTDEIVTFDDLARHLDEQKKSATDVVLTIDRQGERLSLPLDGIRLASDEVFGVRRARITVYPHVADTFKAALGYTYTVGSFIVKLFIPQHTAELVNQSSSVVGISVMVREAAQTSMYDLGLLIAAISMSLGFMNLLPLLPLDGGHVVVELIQAAFKRRLSERILNIYAVVGLVLFGALFLFSLKNDLLRLFLPA